MLGTTLNMLVKFNAIVSRLIYVRWEISCSLICYYVKTF